MMNSEATAMSSRQEVVEDTVSLSMQCENKSVFRIQANCSDALTDARPKVLLRHLSLLSNASYPVIDHEEFSSAETERSSGIDGTVWISVSRPLNHHWKLGGSGSRLRHEKEKAVLESASLFPSLGTDLLLSKQNVQKFSDAEHFNEKGTRKAALLKECRTTKVRHSCGDTKYISSVFSESHSAIECSKSSRDAVVANWISSSSHFEFGLHSDDATRVSSNEFPSNRFCSSSNLSAASPPERLDEPESGTKAPLSSRWRDIQGAKNWEGLLDPLDLDLRKEILRYGDFAQITYDNIVCEPRSKFAGSARYSKQQMFEKLHKQDNGYEVTKFLYATCKNPLPGALQTYLSSERWDVESNWMGYVAVATEPREIARLGRRDIVIAWRGTVRTIEWLIDAQIQMAPIPTNKSSMRTTALCPKVERGFWSLYTSRRSKSKSQSNQNSASEQVIAEIKRLLNLYKGETLSITLTGHSLGGALATLTAYEIASLALNKTSSSSIIPVTVFTFGSPHVGDAVFKQDFSQLPGLRALRVVEAADLVPKSMAMLHRAWPWTKPYEHVGVELRVDHTCSSYLKQRRDPVDWHGLECYLHLVDGHRGSRFELVTGRDYALLNKYADVLEERYCVPPHWWQVENKGLELSADGRWVEPHSALEDAPTLQQHSIVTQPALFSNGDHTKRISKSTNAH